MPTSSTATRPFTKRRIRFEDGLKFRERFGKRQRFDDAGAILQREDGPAGAAAGTHRADLHDDAGDDDVFVVLAAFHAGEFRGVEIFQAAGVFIERVAGNVEAKRGILARKLLLLGPFVNIRQLRALHRSEVDRIRF